MKRFEGILDNVIFYSFILLATVVPLFFTTINTELYEIPKMYFVYFIATILLIATKTKFLLAKEKVIPKNPILFTFIVFLIFQALSTLTSIDKYTSIFGYPSRLNGGLLSQFSYLVILLTGLINLTKVDVLRILKATVITSFAVAVWGIPSHFGYDPTCVILINELTSSCWHKDFDPTLRIFSTLGQPNWLASYLVLTAPLSVFFAITSSGKTRILYFAAAIAGLIAILFTNSRSGFIGAATSAITFISLFLIKKYNIKLKSLIAPIVLIIVSATILSFSFGTKFTSIFTTPPPDPGSPTESGKIRLVVWKGAVDIFKVWPILGSGPETFVSSYFTYRPLVHNQNSEWEFFYNKAHNEFLNYLANTGILGISGYILFLFSTFFVFLSNFKTLSQNGKYFVISTVSALTGYLVTIFFGFSTVATNTIFFIIISSSILILKKETHTLNLKFLSKNLILPIFLFIAILGLFLESLIVRMYLSDVFEKRAQDFEEINLAKSLVAYNNAISINPISNPYQLGDFSYNIALYTTTIEDKNTVQDMLEDANNLSQKAIKISNNNYLVHQRVAKNYILIANYSEEYANNARTVAKRLTELAPTYPPAYLTQAKIYVTLDELDKAEESTQKALDLKWDYIEAQELMKQLTIIE